MSSSILSQEIDITKFGLLYAGAQKNLGPAGVTVVIVREDLLGNAMDFTPTMLRYDIHAENNSLQHTPDLRHLLHGSGIRLGETAGRRCCLAENQRTESGYSL